MADVGSALAFTALAGIVLFVFFYLLHFIWDRGQAGDTWWWNFFMRSDGPFLGTWSERVAWFQGQYAVKFGVSDPRVVMRDGPLPTSLSSITTYWEQDSHPGFWRLWNYERKNLALVAENFNGTDQTWWRIFPGYLWPSVTTQSKEACYQLIEYEDFARMGLQLVYGGWGMYHLEGWADSVLEAKEKVESIVDYIWNELPIVRPVKEETHGTV